MVCTMNFTVSCNRENTYWQHTTSRKSYNRKSADLLSFFVAAPPHRKKLHFASKNVQKVAFSPLNISQKDVKLRSEIQQKVANLP